MSIFINPNGLNNSGGGGTPVDVPNASTSQAGKVQLSNAIDSDLQSMASTPLATKTALTESKNYTDDAIANLNIQDIIDNLNDHESSLINTEQGLHGVRIWQDKLQQTNDNGATWIDVASNIAIVDDLDSTDTTSALSANQGNIIKLLIEQLQLDLTNHEAQIASETEYGHIKIDNDTLQYNTDGQLVAVGGGTVKSINGELPDINGDVEIVIPNVINDLTIGGTDDALSAEMGKILNTEVNTLTLDLANHEQQIAGKGNTEPLGHVRVDDTTITIDADGVISAVVQDGTLTDKGIVQLSNDIIEDETLSATPKAVFDALEDAKDYADTLIEDLESTLIKHPFELRPTTQGQLEFDMPAIYNLNPDWYITSLHFNSIKLLESQYSIVEKVAGDPTQGYKLVLISPAPDYASAIYELELIGGKALANGTGSTGSVNSVNNILPDTAGNVEIPQATSTIQGVIQLADIIDDTDDKAVTPKAVKQYIEELEGDLTKQAFMLIPDSVGQTEIDMPSIYDPNKHIDIIFSNSIKLVEDRYSIEEKVLGDPTQGYKLVLVDPVVDPTTTLYNLLLISGTAIGGTGVGEGAVVSVNGLTPNAMGDIELPSATVTVEGLTLLSDTVNTDTDKSVTPNAVKKYVDENNRMWVDPVITPPNTSYFWIKE